MALRLLTRRGPGNPRCPQPKARVQNRVTFGGGKHHRRRLAETSWIGASRRRLASTSGCVALLFQADLPSLFLPRKEKPACRRAILVSGVTG